MSFVGSILQGAVNIVVNFAAGAVATAAAFATGVATGFDGAAMQRVGDAVMSRANSISNTLGGAITSFLGGGGKRGMPQGDKVVDPDAHTDTNNIEKVDFTSDLSSFLEGGRDFASLFRDMKNEERLYEDLGEISYSIGEGETQDVLIVFKRAVGGENRFEYSHIVKGYNKKVWKK